jgi:hypothetical protein
MFAKKWRVWDMLCLHIGSVPTERFAVSEGLELDKLSQKHLLRLFLGSVLGEFGMHTKRVAPVQGMCNVAIPHACFAPICT